MFRRGFTLIELLVVIAIIGILLAVVVSFVQGAHQRGQDAAVKETLGQLRNAVGLLGSPAFGAYVAIPVMPCLGSDGRVPPDSNVGLTPLGQPTIRPLIESAAYAAGVSTNSPDVSCTADNNWPPAWAVAIKLRSNDTDWWCVDGDATSKLVKVSFGYVTAPINGTTRTCN